MRALILGAVLLPLVFPVQAGNISGGWDAVIYEPSDKEIELEVNSAMKGYCLVTSLDLRARAKDIHDGGRTVPITVLHTLVERADLLARHCSRYMGEGGP